MRALLIAIGATAGMIATSAAYAQKRLPRECRQEIRQLCGSDRGQVRPCLSEKRNELSATCAGELRERMQQRRTARSDLATKLPPQKFDLVSYGDNIRQAVDFHRAQGVTESPPLVLFIHGGGWAMGDRTRATHAKAKHFTAQGYAFASAGYRVLPDAPVEDQARDVAAAIAKLRSDANDLGYDPDLIILMGHSAGAHLAALVATDASYIGENLAAIKGVVLLDSAGYDIATTMASRSAKASELYNTAFSLDVDRQKALSPVTHVGDQDVQNWLILHVAERQQSRNQSIAFASRLSAAGASAEVMAVADTDHGQLNRNLGRPGDAATAKVDAFLKERFTR